MPSSRLGLILLRENLLSAIRSCYVSMVCCSPAFLKALISSYVALSGCKEVMSQIY